MGRGDKLRQSKAVNLMALPHTIAPDGALEHTGRGPERILKGTPAIVIQTLGVTQALLPTKNSFPRDVERQRLLGFGVRVENMMDFRILYQL